MGGRAGAQPYLRRLSLQPGECSDLVVVRGRVSRGHCCGYVYMCIRICLHGVGTVFLVRCYCRLGFNFCIHIVWFSIFFCGVNIAIDSVLDIFEI